MSAHKKLMRRPRPYSDESLASYIIRLTESNYYSDTNWIFQMSGLKKKTRYANLFIKNKDDLSGLSLIADVSESILWSMAFSPVHQIHQGRINNIEVFGGVLPKKALHKNTVKFCPICLESLPYYRLIWDLAFIKICPLHECLLIDKCPQCSNVIKWNRPSITKCKCSQNLMDCSPQFIQSEFPNLGLHIYKLCQIGSLGLGETEHLSQESPIMGLDLNRLVSLLYFLFDFSQLPYIRDKFSSRFQSQSELFNYGCYFDIAFSILNNWQQEFISFISSYEDYLERTYGSGKRIAAKSQDVLQFFRLIFNCFPGESYQCIHTVIEDYFWQLLARISLNKIQISWQKPFQSLSCLSTSIQNYQYLLSSVATELNLKQLTLSLLFIWSQIEIHEDIIFFKITTIFTQHIL